MRTGVLATFVAAAALSLGGCTSTYQQRETSGTETSSVRLDPSKGVFVSVTADGRLGGKTYGGTGQLVAQKTAASFSRYARRVETGGSPTSSRVELLAATHKAGAGYLVVPTISHWEQRATEWSGIPSRVSIGLAIIDAETGLEVRSSLLESRSAIMTFVRPSTDQLAQHLLDENISELYGVRVVPPSQ